PIPSNQGILMPFLSPYLTPIVLLIGSNVFMTTAWYWHLRYKDVPIVYVIFISWSLALITFVVFAGFSYLYLQEPITLSQGFGFALIATGAFFVFHTW
ncbi:MAG: DMT family protein, partial [Pseudolabrys sp.]